MGDPQAHKNADLVTEKPGARYIFGSCENVTRPRRSQEDS